MKVLTKFVKVEMIRDVPLEYIVDLMDKYEDKNKQLDRIKSIGEGE